MAKIKIEANLGVLLTLLGRHYGNAPNALKEYISNALDEWIKAIAKGEMEGPCEVSYYLEKDKIRIDYNSPGMDKEEFEAALKRVGESIKRGSLIPQIGELGIGIFAFNQVGRTCTFYSKKSKGTPTIKVVLTSDSDEADIEIATKRESRQKPGMTIIITRLLHDPTKPRGSLTAEVLQRFFAERYDAYLREGNLKINIYCNNKIYEVKPLEIGLPEVGEAFREVPLSTDWKKKFYCQFWFDPFGKSKVSIRHRGVVIIEDLGKTYPHFEDSIYASGFLKGYIDADFLKPQPSRTSFVEDKDWIQFLKELDKISPSLEAEIEERRREEEERKLTEIQKLALRMAQEILSEEVFKDLEPLKGLRKSRGAILHPDEVHKKGKETGKRSKEGGELHHYGGFRIAYQEIPFEDGPSRHSRFVSGIVQVNTINEDYIREMNGSDKDKLNYATLMIGKEAIAYNDKSGTSDYFLEKLLSFHFRAKAQTSKVKLAK